MKGCVCHIPPKVPSDSGDGFFGETSLQYLLTEKLLMEADCTMRYLVV
jgi:hypothetical protein